MCSRHLAMHLGHRGRSGKWRGLRELHRRAPRPRCLWRSNRRSSSALGLQITKLGAGDDARELARAERCGWRRLRGLNRWHDRRRPCLLRRWFSRERLEELRKSASGGNRW
jgi:hypothetical protein